LRKVFNIQRYSIHDGPGIRTTVFFKGCPLKCLWCHNPESQNFNKELVQYKDRCINCGYCIKACKMDAIENKENCILCENCCEECPTNSRVMLGKEMTINEILQEVEKDRAFYDQSKGGVTLSGGEPLSQGEFLLSLVKELKMKSFHITIDTSGYAPWENIEELLPYVDLFLYDLKIVNEEKHKFYTGVSNKIIIDNLRKLAKTGTDIYIRIPIIPTINDGDEDIKDFLQILKEIGGFEHINFLPYHNISTEKYNRLNLEYKIADIKEPSSESMKKIKNIFENHGFKVKIGG
jgi:pyruvate formate lyase activating enzyme